MADSTPIRVCVVALVYGERGNVRPDDLKELTAKAASYAVHTKGTVYGDSPDEWIPFDDGASIATILKDVGFEVTSLSSHLTEPVPPAKLKALASQVDLYIFDPLFLALHTRMELIHRLDTAVGGGNNKRYCVLLPKRIPAELRDRLSAVCDERLVLTKESFAAGDEFGEWEIATRFHLSAFLKKVLKQLIDAPLQSQLDAAQGVLVARGALPLSLSQPPRFGA